MPLGRGFLHAAHAHQAIRPKESTELRVGSRLERLAVAGKGRSLLPLLKPFVANPATPPLMAAEDGRAASCVECR